MVQVNPGSTDGFQVVMSDLQMAAQTFSTEATAFTGIMPGTPAVQGLSGSGAYDAIFQAVLEAIWALQMQIGGDIGDHGTKLQRAHDNYQGAEESLTTLIGQISDPNKVG